MEAGIPPCFKGGRKQDGTCSCPCIPKVYMRGGYGVAPGKICNRGVNPVESRGIEVPKPDGNGIGVTVPALKAVGALPSHHLAARPSYALTKGADNRFLRLQGGGCQQEKEEQLVCALDKQEADLIKEAN